MSVPSVQLPSRISRAYYGTVAILCLAFGVIGRLAGDEPSLTVLKLLVVPTWCLSILGLNAIRGSSTLEARWTVQAVEYVVLHAWLAASFTTVLQWTPGQPLPDTLVFLAIMLGVMTSGYAIGLWIRIRRLRRETASGA